ncbi:MAG TPA: hypothetical protein VMY59_02270 [Candidatus Thermoplasmatota archaeon]|nr:hypothetical protein [Candidatus Thermoplasmatota archaeon]
MNKEKSEDYNIELDRSIRDSGVQGGKIIGERLPLGSFIIGIPLLIIGLYALFSMLFGFGFPTNTATIILVLLVIVIGLLSIVGGYSIYRAKHVKN